MREETGGFHRLTVVCGICRGGIIPGFLRWCEMGFVQQYCLLKLQHVFTAEKHAVGAVNRRNPFRTT